MIYSPDNLLKALNLIFGCIGAVSESDLRRIFETLLTPWTRTILNLGEENYVSANDPTTQAQERNAVFDQARKFADMLSNEEKIVIVHKSNDISDDSVAAIIKKSRPTVAKIKGDAYIKVKDRFLTEVDVADQEFAMQVLIDELASQIESLE